MDTMLQMQILQEDTRGLFVPTSIQKMVINTKKHFSMLQTLDAEKPGEFRAPNLDSNSSPYGTEATCSQVVNFYG